MYSFIWAHRQSPQNEVLFFMRKMKLIGSSSPTTCDFNSLELSGLSFSYL